MPTTAVGKIKGTNQYQLVVRRSFGTSKRLTISGPVMEGNVHTYTLTCEDSATPNATRKVGSHPIAPDPDLPGVQFRFKVKNCGDGSFSGHPEGIVAQQPEDDAAPSSDPK